MVTIKTTEDILDLCDNYLKLNQNKIKNSLKNGYLLIIDPIKFTNLKWALVEEQKKALKDYRNPYPKDLFVWNNKEKLDFDRGRFNKFTHKLVENIREDLRKILFGEEKE